MGEVVSKLLYDVEIPKMFRVRQIFPDKRVGHTNSDIINRQLELSKFSDQIKPGMNIAITVGSRQIANITIITRAIVDFVKLCGAHPFIIAAMGSHGGATSEGQREILKRLGHL